MTVVTKTAMPTDNAALAPSFRARRPVDLSLLDSASGAFTSATPEILRTQDPSELSLPELDGVLDHGAKVFWQYMRPEGRPSFTFGLLRDMKA